MRRSRLRAAKTISLGAAAVVAAYLAASFASTPQRWYAPEQARAGKELYAAHCLSCHGANGAGAKDWRTRGADGAYPPPPLNGTAHTWHHNLAVLRRTIDRGGAQLGGKMPAFGDKLSAEERDAVIAYFQSLWTDEIYQIWAERVQKSPAP